MASQQLIAKASFMATLLRPDPISIPAREVDGFHSLLNSVISRCTSSNIQNCKKWILENILQSEARCLAFGKYLTGLSSSFEGTGTRGDISSRKPSSKRQRLHLLYLINDILHHGKYRINDMSIPGKLQPLLMGLFGSAASFRNCPKHQRKISDLLYIWQEKSYYGRDYIGKLRETTANAQEAGEYEEANGGKDIRSTKITKSAPYIMPAMHGDSSTPWFDLPAGNMMPHIVPNSTRPINPDLIKPLKFVSGPADESLVRAVKALLEDVQSIYGTGPDQDDKALRDIDELGQPIILDEVSGDVIDGEGYYGWSRDFCEKTKRRKKGLDLPKFEDRGRSRSSSPGGKKRPYSDSEDESSRERYRSRRRRSYGSSRSPTPEKDRRPRSQSRSRSYTRSPERVPPPPSEPARLPLQAGVPPPPAMPTMPPPPFQQQQMYGQKFPPPPPPIAPQSMPFNGYGPPQGMPYNGQQQQFWQPHPPPVPFNGQSQHMPQYQPYGNQQHGNWPPPPPPPPPGNPPMQYQQSQSGYPPSGPNGWQGNGNGRGFNGNGWNGPARGRGSYRGRGW